MTYEERLAEILDEHQGAVPAWAHLLGDIMQDLRRLEAGKVDMKVARLGLEAAGMWPAVPTEMWEERNGSEARYLRLYFPQGTPVIRTKKYIGCKPEAIADARRKTANRLKWEEFQREISRLERNLGYVKAALGRANSLMYSYRVRDLGTPAAPAQQPTVPKVEQKAGLGD